MASAPLRFCPRCGTKGPVGQRCHGCHPAQSAKGWQTVHGQNVRRIRGRALQRLRMQLFANEPFCRICQTAVATIRDHIVPLADGGTDDPCNIQPLCRRCSDIKTQREAARA